jgi:ribosomal protein L11 methyltransferase
MPAYSLICKVHSESSDGLIGILSLHGMNGCEEKKENRLVEITAYFKNPHDRAQAKKAILELPGIVDIVENTIQDQDWNAAWREKMEPVEIAAGVWVSPKWLSPPKKKGDCWIKIEPKMAFGSGHHETTRLAGQAVIGLFKKGGRQTLLDIGSGSGILCFAAGLFGAQRCMGFEIDPDCRENLAENLRDNPQECRIDFCIGGIDALKPQCFFDVIAANMIYPESAPLLAAIRNHLASAGRFVWSGILADGRDEAIVAAGKNCLGLIEESLDGEWWAGVFA